MTQFRTRKKLHRFKMQQQREDTERAKQREFDNERLEKSGKRVDEILRACAGYEPDRSYGESTN